MSANTLENRAKIEARDCARERKTQKSPGL